MIRRVAAAVTGGFFLFVLWLNAAPPSSRGGMLPVPPGTTAAPLTRRLVDEGHVRSLRWLRFLMRASGADRRLRTGVYEIEEGMSTWGIVRRLASGRGVTFRVTVPEGWTADKIAERLEAQSVCGRGPFLAAVAADGAEGFLFPDTYEFDPYASPERVREAMTSRFAAAWRALAAELPPDAVEASSVSARLDRLKIDGKWWPVRDVVVLASIVEREGGRPEELALIAAVYHNRLKKKMRLEADPTVQYALGRWKERLLYRDLEVDSPYNTYKRYGLPPGPIGNPGALALKAAAVPADAPFLYFVADQAGGHVFSESYAGHLRNVQDYRRRRRAARQRR